MSKLRRLFGKNKPRHGFSRRRRKLEASSETLESAPEGRPAELAPPSSSNDARDGRAVARLGRTAEFRVPHRATSLAASPTVESFEIQVRRVQGHWISKVRTVTPLDDAKVYAGLGSTVGQSLLELARHLEADLALEDLTPEPRPPRRLRSH